MEIIRVKRKITSSQIRISELKKFIGKHVEITVTERKPAKRGKDKNLAAGILDPFGNPDMIII
ncbi:MAG: hypothetical protein QM301_03765 [Bacteroidota bacterium]|jgi:hypothetical protein|nr:hypothetical protein [Prolixibacteraceae bacterium]MDI9563294.1 hypothetical protein [Bacteroidota bacterium]NLS98628.1 hypothetical protein [Bacteroidales bacterium]HNZ68468.1 hypothetical protein [Prolixibacteraceae bacterium]HOC86319.1 hypothetical protein [Prolixibacteraceae bacterium]